MEYSRIDDRCNIVSPCVTKEFRRRLLGDHMHLTNKQLAFQNKIEQFILVYILIWHSRQKNWSLSLLGESQFYTDTSLIFEP
jgi:hypothetical protein